MLLVLETDNRVPYYFLCLSQLAVLWNLLEPSDKLDCSQSQQEAPDAADAPWDSWEGLPLPLPQGGQACGVRADLVDGHSDQGQRPLTVALLERWLPQPRTWL